MYVYIYINTLCVQCAERDHRPDQCLHDRQTLRRVWLCRCIYICILYIYIIPIFAVFYMTNKCFAEFGSARLSLSLSLLSLCLLYLCYAHGCALTCIVRNFFLRSFFFRIHICVDGSWLCLDLHCSPHTHTHTHAYLLNAHEFFFLCVLSTCLPIHMHVDGQYVDNTWCIPSPLVALSHHPFPPQSWFFPWRLGPTGTLYAILVLSRLRLELVT